MISSINNRLALHGLSWTSMFVSVLSLFACSLGASAATYHVRADGSASNKTNATNCSSPHSAMNMQTQNWQSFSPGDTIVLCSEGGVFREMLWIPSSGSPGAPITYTGQESAVIAGSDLVQNWQWHSGGVFRASVATSPQQVFADGAFGDRKDNLTGLNDDLDWYWESGVLYLFSSAGDPDARFVNPGVEAGARDFVVSAHDISHVTVEGITARHSQGDGIFIYNNSDFFVVQDSIIEWNYAIGINATGHFTRDGGRVENNIVRANGGCGMTINTSHRDTVIRGNDVYENGHHHVPRIPQHFWTAGIKMWSNFEISRATIEDNAVHDNGFQGGGTDHGIGIWLDENAGPEGGNLIRRNLIYSNNSFGIYLEKTSNTEVAYNVVIDNAQVPYTSGIGVRSSFGIAAGNNFVHNNTIADSHYWGLYCGVFDSGDYPKIINNSFINNISIGSGQANLFVEYGCTNNGTHGWGNVFQYNAFGAEWQGFIWWDWVPISTYSHWESTYGQQAFSILGDPRFSDPVNGDYSLMATSPCVDSGLSLNAERALALASQTNWPNNVLVLDQNDHGTQWEVGAYCFSRSNQDPSLIFADGTESGDLSSWIVVY